MFNRFGTSTKDAKEQDEAAQIASGDLSNYHAIGPDQINALQSGTTAAEGMPAQAADISPVEMTHSQLVQEFFTLKTRFNMLESMFNTLCDEKHGGLYKTMA